MLTVALAAQAGDVNKGYTFTPGEKNVTHTKLNNLVDLASINPTFITDKAAATVPNNADLFVIYSQSAGDLRKATLLTMMVNNTNLISTQTEVAAPATNSLFLMLSPGGFEKICANNLFSNWPSLMGSPAWIGSLSTASNNPLFTVWDPGSTNWRTVSFTNLPSLLTPTNLTPAASLTNTDKVVVYTGSNATPQSVTLSVVSNAVTPRVFTAGPFAITNGYIMQIPHGWTNTPQVVRWTIVCTNADTHFEPGDEVDASQVIYSSSTPRPLFMGGANTSNVWVSINPLPSSSATIADKTSGQFAAFWTSSKWNLKVYAELH